MEHAETYGQQHAAMQALLRGVTYLLILLMPFSVFFAVGLPADQTVLALYAQRGFYLSDLPLAFLLVLTLVGDVPWRRGPVLITASLAAICVLAFISVPKAVSPPFALYVAVRWLLALYLYFWFLQPVVPVRRVAAVLGIGLGLQAIVAIAQAAAQGPLNLPGELTLARNVAGAAVIAVDGLPWLRPYGLTFHPNVLAGFLAVGLILLVPWLERLPVIGLWWLLWSGILLTFSRAAWLALVLALPMALLAQFVKRPNARSRLALAVGVSFVLAFTFLLSAVGQIRSRLNPLVSPTGLNDGTPPPATSEGVEDLEGFSLSERAALAEVAWEIVEARPLNGVGAGNFPLTMPHLRPEMRAQSVHNVPLLLAAEVGVLGGAFWLVIGFAVAARFIWHWRKSGPWLLSAICAWLALATISFFDSYPWSLNSGLLLTAMVLGLAGRSVRDSA